MSGVPEKGDKWGGQVDSNHPNKDGRFGLLASAPGENAGDGFAGAVGRRGRHHGRGLVDVRRRNPRRPHLGAAFGAAIDE